MKKKVQLSDHFSYPKLIRFTFPSILMMIFTSIYSVVDGLFVSNFAGKTAFAAINLTTPLWNIPGMLGFMVGSGGTAVISRTLGEGKRRLANEYFSMLIYFTVIAGSILTAVTIALLRPACVLLGAEGQMLEDCLRYCRIIFPFMPFFMLQFEFQSFLITAEKAGLGLAVTVGAGVTNMVLDALFVAGFRWGLEGAAAATAMSMVVGGGVPVIYFALKNNSLLKLGKTRFYGRILLKTCTNGVSELLNNLSASLVTMLYNFQLLRFAGEDGVAAYGAIMYVAFIFAAVFIGYSVGSAPVIGFHYGARTAGELKNVLHKSLCLIGIAGVLMFCGAMLLAAPLSGIFVGYDRQLYEMTLRGFYVFSFTYLFSGFNIFASSFFTALSNGAVSAAISVMRTLVFQVICVVALPVWWGLDGVWVAGVAAELLSLFVSAGFLIGKRKPYKYG